MLKPLRLLSFLVLALALAACSNVSAPPTALEAELDAQKKGQLTPCEMLYAGGSSGVQLSSSLPYGELATLILSFADDAFKARAIDWMGVNLGLNLGDGLGVFENLPMLAIRAPVSLELVGALVDEFEPLGLVSIWEDQPLTYFLNDSSPYIGADSARAAFGLSGQGIGVAVIDSGIDATHPDLNLGENIGRNVKLVGSILEQPLGGYLYVDLENTDLTSGHGTHVAGTIGGSGAASNGRYTGVAPGATMIGVGAGDALFILYALQSFDFVMKPEIREGYNVRIISNSWGSSGRFAPYHPISLATKRAYDAGMMVVFAAGNNGPEEDTLNPYSASPCAISVAAGDKDGNLVDFSSRGIPGDPYHRPDITAPGRNIIAARALTGAVTPPYTGDLEYGLFYSSISGTSMATPHVSGTLALMLEANPELTFEQALDIMQATARPIYDGSRLRESWEVGAGYLDAYAAVAEAVRSNRSRYSLETNTLASWQGNLSATVCLVVACLNSSKHEFSLTVPRDYTALRISIDWGNPAMDLDLYVYDPAGNLAASSATLDMPEAVSIPSPAAGTWTVVVEGYLNTPITYSGVAEGDTLVGKRR